MVIAALIMSLVAFLIDVRMMGTSFSYFKQLTTGAGDWPFQEFFQGRSLFVLFFLLACLKGATNCITVGSGLSAGFNGPSLIMGLFIGASVATLLGYTGSDGSYYAFLAAGMAGLLSSSMNVPLSAAIMVSEIFGPAYSLPATVASLVAFQLSRSSSLYNYQIEEQRGVREKEISDTFKALK